MKMKKILMTVWALLGLYFIVAAIGGGCMTIAIGAMICGFMVARNMADIVAAEKAESDAVEALAVLIREVRAARDGMGANEALLLAPGLHRAGQYLDQIGYDKATLLV